ncbi:hypothetical protein BGW80DRAFT_1353073, partial [Lactifluus volemus]
MARRERPYPRGHHSNLNDVNAHHCHAHALQPQAREQLHMATSSQPHDYDRFSEGHPHKEYGHSGRNHSNHVHRKHQLP